MRYPVLGRADHVPDQGFGLGRLVGVASWLGYIAAIVIVTAMVAVSFGGYATTLFVGENASSPGTTSSSPCVLVVMLVLNLVGTKAVAAAQSAIVFVVLAVFAVFICATLPNIDTSLLAFSGYPSFTTIVGSVALTFFAYLGFNVITFTGGDLRDPQRDIPRATYLSIGITAVVYVLIAIGVFGTLTVTEVIGYGETAIAEAARPTLGDAGFKIMAVVALLSTAGCTNATLYASSNLTNMLAEHGLFPEFFGSRSRFGPRAGSDHHHGPRPRRCEPRRPVVDRLGRQRRLAPRLPAGRPRRLATAGRHRKQQRDRAPRGRRDRVVLVFFAIDTIRNDLGSFIAIVAIAVGSFVLDALFRRPVAQSTAESV